MKEEIYLKMNNHNAYLSKYACKDAEAILEPHFLEILTV